MSKLKIETGSSPAGERFSITVTEEGPYLVYGRPPLAEQFIMPNESNESWYFQQKYCVFARFCHPHGDAWTLTEASDDPEARKLAIREASMCPSGRLTAWDKETMKPFEFRFEPSLGLIEDITIGASGGLWIRGGIPMRREGGHTYEIRNRVVACRCGQSANKPYCDGTHASIKWKDDLAGEPVGETLPEEVY